MTKPTHWDAMAARWLHPVPQVAFCENPKHAGDHPCDTPLATVHIAHPDIGADYGLACEGCAREVGGRIAPTFAGRARSFRGAWDRRIRAVSKGT